MFSYTQDTVNLIAAGVSAVAAGYFVLLVLSELGAVIRDAFWGD
jgi:hypothetical protein